MTPRAAARTRDAARTRAAVLDAAEELFAGRGYEATSLADVGAAAGVSRGTPSYFFGSKEELHAAVLDRLYRARDERLGPPFAELVAWADARDPDETLESVLRPAVAAYIGFLRERPSFVAIFEREALAGADRLRRIEDDSTVMEDAFRALRRRARARGLEAFDPAEAVIALVALAYLPVAHRSTILSRHGLSLEDDEFVARRVEHVTDVLLHVLGAPGR